MLESHDNKDSSTKLMPFISLLCVILIAAHPVQIHAASEVEITYTGNEGFLIEAEGKKILIDAFHRLGNIKNQELLQNGQPPFDDVNNDTGAGQ